MRQINIKDENAKSLIDFSKYDNSDESFKLCLEEIEALFRDKSQSTKDKLFKAGGYKNLFRLFDKYFGEDGDTVNIVTGRFLALATLQDAESLKVKDDDGGYRFKIKDRYTQQYGFRYPSDFIIARNLVVSNFDLTTKALHKTSAK